MKEIRQKLVEYLYPTKQIMGLMCNDIYQELLEIIPIDCCICDENSNPNTRAENLGFVKGAIKGFIAGNKNYKQALCKHYNHNNIDAIVYDIFIGLVLYIASAFDDFVDVDIINDNRSVCYEERFVLDLVS